jgi:hypothetical protein
VSTAAIIMLLVTIVLVWGGLAVAILSLRSRPTPPAADVHRDL